MILREDGDNHHFNTVAIFLGISRNSADATSFMMKTFMLEVSSPSIGQNELLLQFYWSRDLLVRTFQKDDITKQGDEYK